ncbi:MAG: hypothetical protein BWY91_02440 [bacterium ADurb.BinA028]|nr:MAG: hypothetical protein BWY91_02440 [bacterium ADurb.BinA028]
MRVNRSTCSSVSRVANARVPSNSARSCAMGASVASAARSSATARIVRPPPLAAAAARSVSSTVGARSDSASDSAVS